MNLKQYIEKKGHNQEDFAARVGISQPYVSLLIKGKRRPSLAVAVRIKRATMGKVPESEWIADGNNNCNNSTSA